MTVLRISDFSASFKIPTGLFGENDFQVIHDLNLTLEQGEIVTIVGSSGSGKSVFASALFDILPKNCVVSGRMYYKDTEVKNLLGKATYIPQTSSFLDPLIKVEKQIKLSSKELSQKSRGRYPFQCSGGMIRSVLFDLVHESDSQIIIADEPTPGMDLASATKALSDLRILANEGKAVLLITHDIDIAIHIADRIAVFSNGTIVETLSSADFSAGKAQQQYTKDLFTALPQNSFAVPRSLT